MQVKRGAKDKGFCEIMADNYLEKKYEDLQARKAKEQRLRQVAWKKRMDAYRKKLEAKEALEDSACAKVQEDSV